MTERVFSRECWRNVVFVSWGMDKRREVKYFTSAKIAGMCFVGSVTMFCTVEVSSCRIESNSTWHNSINKINGKNNPISVRIAINNRSSNIFPTLSKRRSARVTRNLESTLARARSYARYASSNSQVGMLVTRHRRLKVDFC